MVFFRSVWAFAPIGMLAGILSIQTAVAQSDYPMSREMRTGSRPGHMYGTFDVDPGQTQTLSKLKQADVHQICVEGGKATVIADGETFELDSGDCINVEASEVKVEGEKGGGEAAGTHIRDRLPRMRTRQQ